MSVSFLWGAIANFQICFLGLGGVLEEGSRMGGRLGMGRSGWVGRRWRQVRPDGGGSGIGAAAVVELGIFGD